MRVQSLDHVVLTVRDLAASRDWYVRVLGMTAQTFGEGRVALHFGNQKLNLHPVAEPFDPHAETPTPGSADVCFLTDTAINDVQAHLMGQEVMVLEGPVSRTGAQGTIVSVYVRDPDGNLVEIANRSAS